MKKRISVLVVCLLVAAMIFTLAGCGGKNALIGTWKAEIDLSEQLSDYIAASDETISQYFTDFDFGIVLFMEFYEDGTCKTYADKEALKTCLTGLTDDLVAAMRVYMEDMMNELYDFSSLGMTLDEVLEMSGISLESLVDELMAELMDEDTIDEMLAGLEFAGKYKLEGDKLYTSDDVDEEVDKDDYMKIQLTETQLTLLEAPDLEDDFGLLPMVFNKIK